MVSVTGDEIRTSDVARVNDMASNVSFGRDHELLHAIPQDYLIDQQGGISEPIGMTGSRLEAEVYLVTVLSSVLQNLRSEMVQTLVEIGAGNNTTTLFPIPTELIGYWGQRTKV